MIDKIVVRAAEAELARGRMVASTPRSLLPRAERPASGPGHHKVELSYAFLVDEQRGTLRALVWSQEARRGNPAGPARLVELSSNLVWDCPLNVKAERLLGTCRCRGHSPWKAFLRAGPYPFLLSWGVCSRRMLRRATP